MPDYRINWEELKRADWLEQDVVLAERLGCSRERVRQARAEFAKGVKPKLYRKRTRDTVKLALAGMKDIDRKTLPELALAVGCSEQRVAKVLTEMKQGFKHRPAGNSRYDWSKFPANWKDITDKEIGLVVGVDNPVVVTQWRNRHGYVKQN